MKGVEISEKYESTRLQCSPLQFLSSSDNQENYLSSTSACPEWKLLNLACQKLLKYYDIMEAIYERMVAQYLLDTGSETDVLSCFPHKIRLRMNHKIN